MDNGIEEKEKNGYKTNFKYNKHNKLYKLLRIHL